MLGVFSAYLHHAQAGFHLTVSFSYENQAAASGGSCYRNLFKYFFNRRNKRYLFLSIEPAFHVKYQREEEKHTSGAWDHREKSAVGENARVLYISVSPRWLTRVLLSAGSDTVHLLYITKPRPVFAGKEETLPNKHWDPELFPSLQLLFNPLGAKEGETTADAADRTEAPRKQSPMNYTSVLSWNSNPAWDELSEGAWQAESKGTLSASRVCAWYAIFQPLILWDATLFDISCLIFYVRSFLQYLHPASGCSAW